MTTEPIVRIRDVEKRITLHILNGKIVEPLKGVSLDINEREFLGIVGPSGAGKSSLLKCIYRTYVSDSGKIELKLVDGSWAELVLADDREIINLRNRDLGYVSQFLKAPPRITAIEVVALPMVSRGVPELEAHERATAALDRLGIDSELQSSYPSLFSGGEQQRVNVARALVDPPRLLLLDEPTSALDADNRAKVLEFLLEVRDAGTTMIGVFHDIEMLEKLADRVVVLEDGVVKQTGPLSEVDIPRYLEPVEAEPIWS